MSAPTADRWAKLKVAKRHVDTTKRRTKRLIESGRELVPVRQEFNEDRSAWVVRVGPGWKAPRSWRTTIGEALYHFRGALDYLVRDLIITETGGDPGEKSQFPICYHDTDFQAPKGNVQRNMLWGLDKDRIDAIESFQPYKPWNGMQGPDHPLAIFRELSNHDKHRFAQVAAMSALATRFWVDQNSRNCTIYQVGGVSITKRPLDVPTEALVISLRDIRPEPKVDVYSNIQSYVGFRNGAPCESTLDDIGACITEILGAFEPFLETRNARAVRRRLEIAQRPPPRTDFTVQVENSKVQGLSESSEDFWTIMENPGELLPPPTQSG